VCTDEKEISKQRWTTNQQALKYFSDDWKLFSSRFFPGFLSSVLLCLAFKSFDTYVTQVAGRFMTTSQAVYDWFWAGYRWRKISPPPG
jgi:hypothetical protein